MVCVEISNLVVFEQYVEEAGDEVKELRGFTYWVHTSGCMQRDVCIRLDWGSQWQSLCSSAKMTGHIGAVVVGELNRRRWQNWDLFGTRAWIEWPIKVQWEHLLIGMWYLRIFFKQNEIILREPVVFGGQWYGVREEEGRYNCKRAIGGLLVVMETFCILTMSVSVSWSWYYTVDLQDVIFGENWVQGTWIFLYWFLKLQCIGHMGGRFSTFLL